MGCRVTESITCITKEGSILGVQILGSGGGVCENVIEAPEIVKNRILNAKDFMVRILFSVSLQFAWMSRSFIWKMGIMLLYYQITYEPVRLYLYMSEEVE
jgi:hypothetical protein